jgi:hypothetical protein
MNTLTVYKYPLPLRDYFEIDLPLGAEILTAQIQGNTPQMWALVDPSLPTATRYFRLTGTGHPIRESQEDLRYISTFQQLGGSLISHLFEISTESESLQ